MYIAKTIAELNEYLSDKRKHHEIGFVPTMGALHRGHLSLLEKAKKDNGLAVVSIFVNPTQFNDSNDFDNYPRIIEQDVKLLVEMKCDLLFAPAKDEIYPDQNIIWTDIDLGHIEKVMEGSFRPGHFRGVKTVVQKLFQIVKPQRAYFGEKDYQQLLIIKKMVDVLSLQVNIISCTTQRESDGLAMSSRNRNLSPSERKAASLIPELLVISLHKLKDQVIPQVKDWLKEEISKNRNLKLQYFEILHQDNLTETEVIPGKTRLFIAVYAGETRLIDNMLFTG